MPRLIVLAAPSTVSREIRRDGGSQAYRANRADRRAWERALRPKPCRLARRHDPPMQYHDPLNAGLVLPFQRPRDGRSTLPVLPSLPQLGLLRCREPNP